MTTVRFKEHHYSIDFPVFGYRVFIIYTSSVKESREKISHKVGVYDSSIDADGLHSFNPKVPDSFIFFSPKSTIGTIAHEVSHAIWQMFNYYGMDFENEILAYHLGYMVDKILFFKNEIDKKKNSF